MSKEDYTLNWTDFNVDEMDIIYETHIDILRYNIDLIHDNLANITHDSSVFSYDNATHLDEHRTDEDSNHYVSNNDDRDLVFYSDNRVNHYNGEETSEFSIHYTVYELTDNIDHDGYDYTSHRYDHYSLHRNADNSGVDTENHSIHYDGEKTDYNNGNQSSVRNTYYMEPSCNQAYLQVNSGAAWDPPASCNDENGSFYWCPYEAGCPNESDCWSLVP